MAHDNNYFIDNDIKPTDTYRGFEYALLESPCGTKNGYVRIPDDVCTQLFDKFDIPSHVDQYHSDIITTVTEDYDRFEDLLNTIAKIYTTNIHLMDLDRKTWLTYSDSQGWIGFDVCHSSDTWLEDDGTLRPALPMMQLDDNGTTYVAVNTNIDFMQPLDDKISHDITTIWDEQAVKRECERIIEHLRFGLMYKNQ